MKIQAAIVEDEKLSRETLINMLGRYFPETEIIGTADNVANAQILLNQIKPDVVFLDIQMPDGDGFQLLEMLHPLNFEVIFTTAYDHYAIRAIKCCALDYLLKPLAIDDLKTAMLKLKSRIAGNHLNSDVKILLDNLKTPFPEKKKIVLSTAEGKHIIEVSNIINCESDDCYSRVYLQDKKMILISKTLKEIEEMLADTKLFIRPHKSHLINVSFIKTYLKTDGGTIVLMDGKQIPVSRRNREKIQDYLNHL